MTCVLDKNELDGKRFDRLNRIRDFCTYVMPLGTGYILSLAYGQVVCCVDLQYIMHPQKNSIPTKTVSGSDGFRRLRRRNNVILCVPLVNGEFTDNI